MNLVESLRIALVSLAANKLRSALTMLGIIIGVAAVISLMGVGRGASAAIDSQINSMGTNLLFVTPGSTSESGVRTAQGSAQSLTYEDAVALADPEQGLTAVAAVAPQVGAFGQVVYQGNNVFTQVLGVTDDYASVRNYELAYGDFITDVNVQTKQSVAVLGAGVVEDLFSDGADPLGKSVRINNIPFKVVGVLEAKGGSGMGSQDDQILVPITTAMSRLSRSRYGASNTVSQISVQVASKDQIDTATGEISAVLRQRHNIRSAAEDDFTVQSQEDILESATAITDVLTLFLGGVAGISLLVGGIGIMNIMLVSVTERTREIGIRKAIGATRKNVLAQFLTEATVLSVLGGLIGVAAGAGIAQLISGVSIGSMTLEPTIDLDSVLLATLFSLAVGLFFGIYPAYRASSLNPIEALRYE
jgi:putative ABC transport system permease protein